jgi:uncharacterized membrane protein
MPPSALQIICAGRKPDTDAAAIFKLKSRFRLPVLETDLFQHFPATQQGTLNTLLAVDGATQNGFAGRKPVILLHGENCSKCHSRRPVHRSVTVRVFNGKRNIRNCG